MQETFFKPGDTRIFLGYVEESKETVLFYDHERQKYVEMPTQKWQRWVRTATKVQLC